MRNIKIILASMLITGMMLSFTSCVIVVRKDNGKHKGWYKNPNNPHHPFHILKKSNGKNK